LQSWVYVRDGLLVSERDGVPRSIPLAAVAAFGLIAMGFAGFAVWWGSRRPELAGRLPNPTRFWWSWAIAVVILVGLLVYAALRFSTA